MGVAAAGVLRLVRPDTGRAYAEGQLGVERMQRLVERSDERVHVVAAPVVDAVEVRAVACEGLCIIEIRAGIEVVVEMDAVHIIIADDLGRAVHDELLHCRETGVKVVIAVVFDHPFRMLARRAALGQGVKLLPAVSRDAVGIDPGVQLKAALVRALDPVREHIKVPVGRSAAGAADVAALGEKSGPVECVRRGTHLKKDRVQAHRRDVVEHGVRLGGERLRGHAGRGRIVDVRYACDPDAAHIVLCGLRRAGKRHEHGEHK